MPNRRVAAFTVSPELGDLSLVRRSGRTGRTPQALDFVHTLRVLRKEVSDGGAAGRNSSPVVRANGVTSPHCGSLATSNIGAVGRHIPTSVLPG